MRITEVVAPKFSSYFADADEAQAAARREGSSMFLKPGVGVVIQTVRPSETQFIRLGHAFFALVMGAFGGFLASTLRKRNHP
jgi:hypothetical protein